MNIGEIKKNASGQLIGTVETLTMTRTIGLRPVSSSNARAPKYEIVALTRNVFQVLGPVLDAPADFVLCWTADGEASGGTGQAIRIAAAHGVPVYNFQRPRERAHVERHLSL
ncbi:DUF736 family protein [Sphingobium subterraneum]|uniref:Uncharacterized protein n=1 Tax=Sphingobium subterraneum TaxID=627688 RepID=A0A841J501_9SPHN|nr:DUF736 family protein [Sphingobium subterraneum]MBB6125422.1 hypothetical protein [Sphingobium subterraneum]